MARSDRLRWRPELAETSEISAAQRQLELELALQEAHFSAGYARRQYDAVDPANRLVACELERRWNEALQVVHRLEGEIAELEAKKPAPLGEKERRHLMQLGADLELAWSHPAATAETRKRILRTALHEIVVRIEGSFVEMVLHWQGGDHTSLQLEMNGAASIAGTSRPVALHDQQPHGSKNTLTTQDAVLAANPNFHSG